MKKIITLLLCTVSIYINAQERSFSINGEVKGQESFKYVYAFDINRKMIDFVNIVDGKFLIKKPYQTLNRFGELPYTVILLSNDSLSAEAITGKNLLSNRSNYNCRVILEDSIDLKYDSDKKSFSIYGGQLNKVQDQFNKLYSTYRNRRDSAYASINKTDKDGEKIKVAEARILFKQTVDEMIKLSIENPDSEVTLFNFSAIVFDQLTPGLVVENTFYQFSDRLKNSQQGIQSRKLIDDKILTEKMLKNPAYTVGMKIPKIELINNFGKLINGNAEFGKYTLVDFWATWCVPCRNETPNLILSEKSFKTKGFKVLTISIDDNVNKDKWLRTIKDDQMLAFTNLFNGNDVSGLAKELQIVAIPANYLVDSEGRIVAVNLRGEDLQKKLKELLP